MSAALALRAVSCRTCRHFDNSAGSIEAAMPGLTAMGSGHAAVRSEDGLCRTWQRYLAADASCASHAPTAGRYATGSASTRQS